MRWNGRQARSTLAMFVTTLLSACAESAELTAPPTDIPDAAVVPHQIKQQRGKIKLLAEQTVDGKKYQTFVVYSNKQDWEARKQRPPKTLLVKVDGRVSALVESEYENRAGSWEAKSSRVSTFDGAGKLTRVHEGPVSPARSANSSMVMQADVTGITAQEETPERCLIWYIASAVAGATLVSAITAATAAGAAATAAAAAYAAILLECSLVPNPTCPEQIAFAGAAVVTTATAKGLADLYVTAMGVAASQAARRLMQCLEENPGDEEWPGEGGGENGGGGGTCPAGQELWCDIDVEYYEDTGEVVDVTILGCYCA